VKRSSLPTFPDWLRNRNAVRLEASELWKKLPTEKDPAKAQQVLEQLILNPLMKRVWDELYRGNRDNQREFFNPACLTNASKAAALREKAQELRKKGGDKNTEDARYLDFEARVFQILPEDDSVPPKFSEQDCAVQLFLARAYRIALDSEPVMVSDAQAKVKKLRYIAARLRRLASDLKSMDKYPFPYYAEKLKDVAADIDDDVKVMHPNPANAPWLRHRKRGDLRKQTIVAQLAYATHNLFSKILPSTIANVTNVILDCGEAGSEGGRGPAPQMTRDMVREIVGTALTIQPSFGPLIYPMVEARKKVLEVELNKHEA